MMSGFSLQYIFPVSKCRSLKNFEYRIIFRGGKYIVKINDEEYIIWCLPAQYSPRVGVKFYFYKRKFIIVDL